MVSMRDVNRQRVRELVGNHIFYLYRELDNHGKIEITIKRAQAQKNIVDLLAGAGFTTLQIAKAVEISVDRVYELARSRVTKGFAKAQSLLKHPLALLDKSDDYACDYIITPAMVEWLLIEDLARAGWSANQIVKATGFTKRRVQRIRKLISEEDDE